MERLGVCGSRGVSGGGCLRTLVLVTPGALAALGEERGQPLQRLGRMLQAFDNSLLADPRFGVQSLDEREQRLAPNGILRAVRYALSQLQIPLEQEDELLFPDRPFDRRRDDKPRQRGRLAAGMRRRRVGSRPLRWGFIDGRFLFLVPARFSWTPRFW